MSKQGWVLPNRKVVYCREMKHLEDLADEVAAYVPDYQETIVYLKRIKPVRGERNDFYENELDSVETQLWKTLITAGLIRFVEIRDEKTTYFEGSPPALKSSLQFCKDMAKEAEYDYNFRPITFEKE